ncbi:MAG: hypothetical protein WA667_20380 [Candidatus Nitrosopolaris sp.]
MIATSQPIKEVIKAFFAITLSDTIYESSPIFDITAKNKGQEKVMSSSFCINKINGFIHVFKHKTS